MTGLKTLQGGPRVVKMTHSIAAGMESTASYLRKHDVNKMGKDVMDVCRRYPTPVFGRRITCWIFDRTFAAVKDRSEIISDEFDRFAESRLAQIGRRGLKSGKTLRKSPRQVCSWLLGYAILQKI
jgi:hypothetical protein